MKMKAQSTIEYAALVAIVVASLFAMAVYIQKSIDTRVDTVREDLNKVVR